MVIIAAMALLMGLSVFARYSGLFVVIWANELIDQLFLWLAMFGASIAVRDHAHFRLTLVLEHVSRRTGTMLTRASDLSLLALGLGDDRVGCASRAPSLWREDAGPRDFPRPWSTRLSR